MFMILSTCVGEPVDAFVFFTIVFTGLIPFSDVVAMACVQSIGKILQDVILQVVHVDGIVVVFMEILW